MFLENHKIQKSGFLQKLAHTYQWARLKSWPKQMAYILLRKVNNWPLAGTIKCFML